MTRTCATCGRDVDIQGVLSVDIITHPDGRLEGRPVRWCQACLTVPDCPRTPGHGVRTERRVEVTAC